MQETISHAPVPEPVLAPNQFELSAPRNAQGERIGTGAMVEPLRPGLSGETVRAAILKTLFHAGRTMQAPRGVAEQAENRTGQSFVTEQERAQFAARGQETETPVPTQRQPDAETSQLLQVDNQQTERALAAARSALNSEAAAQRGTARPQPQDKNEGAAQAAKSKVQKEPETETITIRSVKDGHVIGSFVAPKNATSAELNRAAQAAGLDYEIRPSWTTLHGLGIHARDIGAALKKAWQAATPPEATQK